MHDSAPLSAHEGGVSSGAFESETAFREYLDGIPTTNEVRVRLDPATGALMSVIVDLRADTEQFGTAKVTVDRDAAIAVLAETAEMPVNQVIEAVLKVWADPVTEQTHPVWDLCIRTGGSFGATAWGTVDAVDGSLLRYDLSL